MCICVYVYMCICVCLYVCVCVYIVPMYIVRTEVVVVEVGAADSPAVVVGTDVVTHL
jgi:hypothetical protein